MLHNGKEHTYFEFMMGSLSDDLCVQTIYDMVRIEENAGKLTDVQMDVFKEVAKRMRVLLSEIDCLNEHLDYCQEKLGDNH